jgi:hypothetical protein
LPPLAKIGFGDFAEFEIFEVFEVFEAAYEKHIGSRSGVVTLRALSERRPQPLPVNRDRKSANHEPLKNRPPLKKPAWHRDGRLQPKSECRGIQCPAHAAAARIPGSGSVSIVVAGIQAADSFLIQRAASPSVANVSVIRFSSLPYIVTVT